MRLGVLLFIGFELLLAVVIGKFIHAGGNWDD